MFMLDNIKDLESDDKKTILMIIVQNSRKIRFCTFN